MLGGAWAAPVAADRSPPPRLALALYAPAAGVFSFAYFYTPDPYYAPHFVSLASEWVVRPVVGWIAVALGTALGVATYRAPKRFAYVVSGVLIAVPLATIFLSFQSH